MPPDSDPLISVLIPTHNPHPRRLARTLAALQAQTMPAGSWEAILVDNASNPQVDTRSLGAPSPQGLRIFREPTLGLTNARRRGFSEARGRYCILVDDDNVLAPDYISRAADILEAHPNIGAIGGKSIPEFEQPPDEWKREFFNLLALRDLGDAPRISRGIRPPGARRNEYPVDCAPIGAGMALRREAVETWLRAIPDSRVGDRRGKELTSGGDNDLVFSILRAGWKVAYFPELSLTHLIPGERLDRDYLARLNRGIQSSWMQVLTKHDANPWPSIPAWTVPVRKAKAWFSFEAWRGPAAYVRWQGACGHFEGRSAAPRT